MRIWTFLAVTLLAHPAVGYRVKESQRGQPIRWSEAVIPVGVSSLHEPSYLSSEQNFDGIARAFDTWAGKLPNSPSFDIYEENGVAPSRNANAAVTWVGEGWNDDFEPEALAVTLTTFDSRSGRILDAQILLNGAEYQWVTGSTRGGCVGSYDVQNVVTHEVGHLLGLAHAVDESEATMFPSSEPCEMKKRDLSSDDVEGLRYLYELSPAPESSDLPAYGCAVGHSVGQGKGQGAAAFSLATFLLLFRRKRRWILVGAVMVVVLCGPSAFATTMKRLGISELARSASLVVRGVVTAQRVTTVRGRIYTDATVVVLDCWKGPCERSVVVRNLGGVADGKGLSVEGGAELDVGSELVLFLRSRRDGAFSVLGMAQGAFLVDHAEVSRNLSGLVFRDEAQDEALRLSHGTSERLSLEQLRSRVDTPQQP